VKTRRTIAVSNRAVLLERMLFMLSLGRDEDAQQNDRDANPFIDGNRFSQVSNGEDWCNDVDQRKKRLQERDVQLLQQIDPDDHRNDVHEHAKQKAPFERCMDGGSCNSLIVWDSRCAGLQKDASERT
jgi:hypothetical protein